MDVKHLSLEKSLNKLITSLLIRHNTCNEGNFLIYKIWSNIFVILLIKDEDILFYDFKLYCFFVYKYPLRKCIVLSEGIFITILPFLFLRFVHQYYKPFVIVGLLYQVFHWQLAYHQLAQQVTLPTYCSLKIFHLHH